jgi:hypothetical protein
VYWAGPVPPGTDRTGPITNGLVNLASDRWEPAPPSPWAEGAAVELTPEADTEPPAAGLSVEVPAGTAEAPAGAVEVPPSPRGRGSGASPV